MEKKATEEGIFTKLYLLFAPAWADDRQISNNAQALDMKG